MPASNRHRVQRQIVELGLAPALPAAETQERLARELHEVVNPRIAAIFDAAAGPHQLLRLDRLEIDVGRIGGADWAARFGERVVEELGQALARYRPESLPTSGMPEAPGESPSRLLVYFLEHGLLPWWGRPPERGFGAAFEVVGAEPDWSAVHALAQRDLAARGRLIDVFDDSQLGVAVLRWSGLQQAAHACAALAPAATDRLAAQAWRRLFWLTLFDEILRPGSFEGPRLVRALRAARDSARESRRPTVAETACATEEVPGGELRAAAELPSPWREWLVASVSEAGAGNAPVFEHFDGRAGALPPQDISRPTPVRRAEESVAASAVYLPCAGVLLLHPFLDSLFRERGLLAGRAFRDAEARSRAVRLVGALGYGHTDVPEYDLAMAKLLCGHALPEPLEPVVLEPEDLAACEELLGAVLQHWQALRSGSAQWLREQFFLRDGKLEEVDSGFRLTVERRAQDVLLARLPWGFGVLGLPWMEQKIFVHWID